MHRLAALPLLLLSTAVVAQEVPDASRMDLWCGLAFTLLAADAPDDAPPDLVDRFAEGGRLLTDRARAIYLESGYSEENLAGYVDGLSQQARAQLDSADIPDTYSFQECSALLPY